MVPTMNAKGADAAAWFAMKDLTLKIDADGRPR